MEQITIILFFREEGYARRFLRFLSAKKTPGIHVELVTEKERVTRRVGMPSNRLIVLTDDESICEDEKKEVVLLTGEQNRKEKKIFQYQSAENIYRELISLLGVKEEYAEEIGGKNGIITFFSPDAVSTTEISVLMAQYLGGQGRCLYICLSGFPVYYGGEFQKTPDYKMPGLGELLLCPSEEIFVSKLTQLRKSFGSADMLPPFTHYKDLLDCTLKEWKLFLERLQNEGKYDSVIIEIGLLFENLFELLELSDRLFLLEREDDFGKVRMERFRYSCLKEKKDSLFSRAEIIPVPEEMEAWRKELGQQTLSEWMANRQVMAKMKNYLEAGKEEHVYTWEDYE